MIAYSITQTVDKFKVQDNAIPVMPIAMWIGDDTVVTMEYTDALKLASELRIACGAEEPKPNTEAA